MHRSQPHPQHFIGLKEMAQVGAAVVFTGEARALGVDGFKIIGIDLFADIHGFVEISGKFLAVFEGELLSMTRMAGGNNAVELIHAEFDRLHDFFGLAYAHEIARFVDGESGSHRLEYLIHLIPRFPHR